MANTAQSIAIDEMLIDEEHWCARDSARLRREHEAMARAAPHAILGMLRTSGQIYWLVDCGVGDDIFTFMLLYSKAYPESDGDAPVIKAVPLVPDADALRSRLDRSCEAYFHHDDSLNADYISLRPGAYSGEATAADYYEELQRWLGISAEETQDNN